MRENGRSRLPARWGARGLTAALASLFFISLLTGVMPLPRSPTSNASASDGAPFYANATDTGDIYHQGVPYPPYDVQAAEPDLEIFNVGQLWAAGSWTIWRGFIEFDTSTVSVNSTITTATLSVRLDTYAYFYPYHFYTRVWQCDYGTLDSSDWNATGPLQGTLLTLDYIAPGAWYDMPVQIGSVNKTGMTRYMLEAMPENPLNYLQNFTMSFYGGNSTSPPELSLTYATSGTLISILLDSGTYINSTAFPEVADLNLTYNRYHFDIFTVPSTNYVTIVKSDANWTFLSSFPGCAYTEGSTSLILLDVYDNVGYQVWFSAPKASPYSTVHISLFNAFTGEGYFWEQMRVEVCLGSTWDEANASIVPTPDYALEPDMEYTLRVLDYFGNALVDYSVVTSTAQVYASIPVPIYSWQIFNMNDAPVLMRIYWNNSGAPWEFFVGPSWQIERLLKGGDYTFMTTFYDSDGLVGSTVYFNRTVPMTGLNASFIFVTGTSMSEIVSSVQGVMAKQEIITNLISPSVVLIYDNLPIAPAKLRSLSMLGTVTLDPYLVLETMTFQNGSEAAGTNITMGCPYPNISGGSYTILTDVLTFAGPYASWILVNTSAGTSLAGSTSLPASLVLHGATNITIWSNQTVTASRATSWREVSEFTVNYYATEKKYVVTLSFNNSMTLDYYAPYWYIGFPADVVVDPTSVSVWDLDNDIPLSIRTNFEISSGGIHMSLPYLNASQTRNFRITYWDLNGSTPTGAPNLIADSYISKTLGNSQMKYTSVQWVNPWPQTYQGEIYISLNFTYGDSLLQSSITVMDENTGIALSSSDWLYTGRTLLILTSGVGVVGIGQGCNFGIYFTLDTDAISKEKSDFFFDAIVIGGSSFYIGGMGVSLFLVAIAFAWVIVGYTYYRNKDWFPIFVCVLSATIIGFYLQSMLT